MRVNPRQHVLPGERQRIAAAHVNWLNAQMGPRPGFDGPTADPVEPGRNVILAKNQTGGDVARWGVMAITGMAIDPTGGTTHQHSFEELPCVVGGTPTTNTTAWCVAVEPIAAGKIGRAAVSGVVACKLDVTNESDRYAGCKAGTSGLRTSSSGEALILWKPTGVATNVWGLVRIGHARPIVRGTFDGAWPKSAAKTVTDISASSVTYQAKNYFASLAGGTGKGCAIAWVAGEWILIAAEC